VAVKVNNSKKKFLKKGLNNLVWKWKWKRIIGKFKEWKKG